MFVFRSLPVLRPCSNSRGSLGAEHILPDSWGPKPAMGTYSTFLCLLYLCGVLGLSTSPTPRRLHCDTCNFAKPCYPVPTECQDDEACGISIGTSGRSCLPKSQCPLQGHATYWLRSYTLQHCCCEQDLCNVAAALQRLPSPLLTTPLLLTASFAWGGCLLH
nr:lymphocyte antigen 6G6e-like [Loxodonta africana]